VRRREAEHRLLQAPLFSQYSANKELRKAMRSRGSLNHVQNVHLETRANRAADGAASSGIF
jgi:hypothetical protein